MSEKSERLKLARERAGYETIEAAASRLGVSKYTYAQHENGIRGFPAPKGELYARVFKVNFEWLMTGNGSQSSQNRDHAEQGYSVSESLTTPHSMQKIPLKNVRITHRVPVLGVVEAGAWREMLEETIDETTEYVECELPEYKGVPAYCNRVSGTSMNELVDDGGKIIWVPVDFAIGGLQQADFVVVQRPNETPGQLERTVKQLFVRSDGVYELRPCSTDPRWQAAYEIPPRNEMAQEGVEICGLVVETRQPRIRRSGIPVRVTAPA